MSTDPPPAGGLVTTNDESGLFPQHRTANEESGQCQRAETRLMIALSIRSSVLAPILLVRDRPACARPEQSRMSLSG